jgi:hypothetical protein
MFSVCAGLCSAPTIADDRMECEGAMNRVYEYDVFISYKRAGGDLPTWVRTHFHPRLAAMLDDNLQHDAKIFCDQGPSGGPTWPQEVRTALKRSRVLVPVYSPKYFFDEWCLAELDSMRDRERLVAKSGQPNKRLIQPVIYCDSEKFPDRAKDRPMWSFKRWSQPYPHFETSPAYLDFDAELRRFVDELVRLIEHAPPWRPHWPVHTPAPDEPIVSSLPRL